MATSLFVKANETGLKNANEEFLSQDIVPGVKVGKAVDLIIDINISAGATPDIQISFDSGATWADLPDLTLIATDTFFRTRASAINGDLINFRTNTGGGLTLARFLVVLDING